MNSDQRQRQVGSELRERSFKLRELLSILRLNLFDLSISVLLCLELAVLFVLYVPPKFKADALLDIRSNYFKNPLVNDLVSETTDPSELRAQREALIRLALSSEFIDELGAELGLFASESAGRQQRVERERLLKRIEYHSLGTTSFRLSTIARTGAEAKAITQSVLNQVTATVIAARESALLQARDAIEIQVQFLARTLAGLGKVREAEQLQARLKELDQNIAALQSRFTEAHPELIKLRSRAGALRRSLGATPERISVFKEDEIAQAFMLSNSEEPIQNIYRDLLRKLSYLNIVLTMEQRGGGELPMYLSVLRKPTEPTAPFFPNTTRVLLFGLAGGLAAGLLATVYFELQRAEQLTLEDVSTLLQIEHLGRLPELTWPDELLLLDEPLQSTVQSADIHP